VSIFPYEVGDPLKARLLINRVDGIYWVALSDEGVVVWRGRLADLAKSFRPQS
jgi:hypothetical protein